VHVRMDLPARERVRMVMDMMDIWELWAQSIGVAIVCSTTMRGDQEGFVRLHQRRGYLCRGSICYRRLQQHNSGQSTHNSQQHTNDADMS
jgi:hypothetical protein